MSPPRRNARAAILARTESRLLTLGLSLLRMRQKQSVLLTARVFLRDHGQAQAIIYPPYPLTVSRYVEDGV